VLVGGLRILVEEALNHHQVPSDVFSVGAAQGAQLAPCTALEVSGLNLVRNLGLGNALTLRRTTTPVVSSVPRVLPPGAVVETTWPPTVAVTAPVAAVPVATPFVAPVVPAPVIPAVRVAILFCETATRPEAVTLTAVATPTCIAVVRAVLTVLIRHGPSFTPGLPSVPPLSLNTWEEPTWPEALRRNRNQQHVAWRSLVGVLCVVGVWG